MANIDGNDSLRGFYQDLCALSESRLHNVDRLLFELEANIQVFRKLLNHPAKSNTSRQAVISGKIQLDETEYSINEDFRQGTLQLADALNLDELEASRLFLDAQEDSQRLGRPPLISSIVRFHERRQFLLECLRLILRESLEFENEETQSKLAEVVATILEAKDGPRRNGSPYTKKCMTSMRDIEKWLFHLTEQVNKISVLQTSEPEIMEIIEYTRASLEKQHESLGAVVCYLFKENYVTAEDFQALLDTVRVFDRLDIILLHYIPAVLASIVRFGPPDDGTPFQESSSLNKNAISQDSKKWALPNLHAAIKVLWLAEYSGWYSDHGALISDPDLNLGKEAEERSRLFTIALNAGALEFLVAICAGVTPDEWQDPTRQALVKQLTDKVVGLKLGDDSISQFLQILLMEHFERFTESCITNMPDSIRELKREEDSIRLEHIDGRNVRPQRELQDRQHLECFLVIMAFAFEHRVDASQELWADTDSTLYGFLQWASKRQTVPRVSAFCEMLCAVSEGEECATSAHKFLLEDSHIPPAKLRRSTSMNWAQMFAELQLYAIKMTGAPAAAPVSALQMRRPGQVGLEEPESPVMLSCYLRLTAHMCRQSKTARDWILYQRSDVVETLLDLCSNTTDKTLSPSFLRAGVFTVLAALMADKTLYNGGIMWESLDKWISEGASRTQGVSKAPRPTVTKAWTGQIFHKIAESFDESRAFISFLQTLVAPASDATGLHDALPFPENLGQTYRMPGIEPYVDFALGRILTRKSQDSPDPNELQILRFVCLNFIATCLESFNEDLVAIANRSPIPVDSAMESSSLAAYVRLHPFARVMEWLFNENVIYQLFDTAHQDPTQVSMASSTSILVCSLLRSIDVMNLVLDLQCTYLDIVRPMVKMQSGKRTPVSNPSLAAFEDSIMTHLHIVADLSLYCGSGHQQLTLTSLALLQKISSSRKLNKTPQATFGHWTDTNKVIETLSLDVETDRLARSLSTEMQVDPRELEQGPTAPGYLIKKGLLAFLDSCLATVSDRPTIAHLLLGFSCAGNALEVDPHGLLANGASLLHSLIDVVQAYPDGADGMLLAWMIQIKRASLQVLKRLWHARLTSVFTIGELRVSRFLPAQLVNQSILDPDTNWNGCVIQTPEFLVTDAADSLTEFLSYRCLLYEYATMEIRSASEQTSSSILAKTLSTLCGNSVDLNGESITHVTIFNLFDFADVDVEGEIPDPQRNYFSKVDLDLCLQAQVDNSLVLYNLQSLDELLQLSKNELVKAGQLKTPNDEEQLSAEASGLHYYLLAQNRMAQIRFHRHQTLRAWVELVMIMLGSDGMDSASKSHFVLLALQIILPKLERFIEQNVEEAMEVARLAESLTDFLATDIAIPLPGRSGDIVNDRLFHLFRLCLQGVPKPDVNPDLREIFYNICTQYLNGINNSASSYAETRRQSMQTVRSGGEALFEKVCEDAHIGQETTRVSALLLLNIVACISNREKSTFVIEALLRLNFLGAITESIKIMPAELADTEARDIPLLLSYYQARLSLLLQISQSRLGANHVINAGLFPAIQESNLFTADPDIGIDIDNPDALRRYYELLLSVIRIIISTLLSRGLHNAQSVEQARSFLSKNRQNMVAIFKRYANIGGLVVREELREDLNELVKAYVTLLTMVGFVEFEEETAFHKPSHRAFA